MATKHVQEAKQAVSEIQSSSIPDMTNKISSDLDQADRLVSFLKEWMQKLDRKTYKKIEPYTDEMKRAYNAYKADANAVGPARKAFTDFKHRVQRRETAEDCYRLARLAIEWGRMAVRAAEGRLKFLEKYRNVYQFDGIESHIQAAMAMIQSGRHAVEQARYYYNKIYEAEARVFRRIDRNVFR